MDIKKSMIWCLHFKAPSTECKADIIQCPQWFLFLVRYEKVTPNLVIVA